MNRKHVLSVLFFLLVAALTFYAVFHGNDWGEITAAMGAMRPLYLVLELAVALFFVSCEGMMIWYLLRSLHTQPSFRRCLGYSFVGFFFCGITPSATGGQPMQLYYMNKDGNNLSASTVVLMTVALVYKFVLVLMGLLILLFWHSGLVTYLGGYYYLFYLGMALNGGLVAMLLFVMVSPNTAKHLVHGAEHILMKLHILKPSETRKLKLDAFVDGYKQAVWFLMTHWSQVILVTLFTVVQRCCVFILPYLVYRGFGLTGTGPLTVMMLQTTIYIATDLLPLPGAQGITELMYRTVFAQVFPPNMLVASMCVTRGVSFYFLLFVSLVVVLIRYVVNRRQTA